MWRSGSHLRHAHVAVSEDPVVEPEALGEVAHVGALRPEQEVQRELLKLPLPLLPPPVLVDDRGRETHGFGDVQDMGLWSGAGSRAAAGVAWIRWTTHRHPTKGLKTFAGHAGVAV